MRPANSPVCRRSPVGETGKVLIAYPIAVTRSLAAAAAQLALEAGARLAHVALELVARAGAATLELTDAPLGALAGRRGLAQVGDEGDRAVTRLQRGADVHERGALGDVAALLGRGLRGADVGRGSF